MRTHIVLALATGILTALFVATVQAVDLHVDQDSIGGRVFDSSTNAGIPGLSVHLVAPKVANQAVRITVTNTDGRFAFNGLTVGRYLLTIFRGTTLVYRKEIDNRVTTSLTVPLRAVPNSER